MPSKLFCLTVPKNFVQEPFSVSLISGIENFYALEGYVTIFCRIFLCDSAERFRRRGGEYQHFPSKNFCLTVPKFSVGKPFSVSLISGIEKVWIRGGRVVGVVVSRFSEEKFLSQGAENFRRGTLLCCVSEKFR